LLLTNSLIASSIFEKLILRKNIGGLLYFIYFLLLSFYPQLTSKI
jgi:hypothetical protein